MPLATFVPVLFHIVLADGVRLIWAGVNIFSVFIGTVLSIICVRKHGIRSVINVLSTIVSGFWIMLICGIIALAVLLGIFNA